MAKKLKIVCLGGGIGTSNLIRGLKKYFSDITVVVSMADSGGSAGRLRRLYKVHPVGDLVSCMASLSDNDTLSKLLTFRFPGKRYSQDRILDGHKLGNLMVVGAIQETGSLNKAIKSLQELFRIKGKFLPATEKKVSIFAKTIEGKRIYGEDTIDQGKYKGKKFLERIYLSPKGARASKEVIKSIKSADVVIAGPGDLYTNLLPVLIVPGIQAALKRSKAKRIFIVNVANKPFETKNYGIIDYIKSVEKHTGHFSFQTVVVNSNINLSIPRKYNYKFVEPNSTRSLKYPKFVYKDLIDKRFPLYHDSSKLAKLVKQLV